MFGMVEGDHRRQVAQYFVDGGQHDFWSEARRLSWVFRKAILGV